MERVAPIIRTTFMPPAATTSQQALSNMQSFESGAKSPDQIATGNANALGIPAAQQQVSGLRGAINNTTQLLSQVAPSVMGRTQNSLVTGAQASRQIGNEQAPLNDQLNKENTDFSGANADLNTLQGQANTQTQNDITGQQNQLSYLHGIYSDLAASEQQKVANDQFQQQLAEQKAARAASSGGISLAGGAPAAAGAPVAGGNSGMLASRNAAGGYAFSDTSGKPVTMGQYLASNGYSGTALVQQAARLLSQSNGGDLGIANAISSGRYTPAQLEKLYPQVFGGL